MTDMIERVAQAVYDRADNDVLDWKHGEWDELNDPVKGSFRDMARAAIEAMRVSDTDAAGHRWVLSDDQEIINAYIDTALSTSKCGDE